MNAVSFILKTKDHTSLMICDKQSADCSRISKEKRKKFRSCTSFLSPFLAELNMAQRIGEKK